MFVIEIHGTDTVEDTIKFRATDDSRMRTSKLHYDNEGEAYFYGFGHQKFYLKDFIRNDSPWGDKEALGRGVLGQGTF